MFARRPKARTVIFSSKFQYIVVEKAYWNARDAIETADERRCAQRERRFARAEGRDLAAPLFSGRIIQIYLPFVKKRCG